MESKLLIKDSLEVIVKEGDTDIYKHLNNSKYPNYFKEAEEKGMKKLGIKEINKKGNIRESNYKFIKEVTPGKAVIKYEIRQKNNDILFEASMEVDKEETTTALITHPFESSEEEIFGNYEKAIKSDIYRSENIQSNILNIPEIFEKVRIENLVVFGFNEKEMYNNNNIGLIVTESNYKNEIGIEPGEAIVKCRFYKEGIRIMFESYLVINEYIKAKADITQCFNNFKTGKPIRIPKEVLESLK